MQVPKSLLTARCSKALSRRDCLKRIAALPVAVGLAAARHPETVGYFHDPRLASYDFGPAYPESPQRVLRIHQRLEESGLMSHLTRIEPHAGAPEAIRAVHSPRHIAGIRDSGRAGEVALLATAGVLGAVEAVCGGNARCAFCNTRPPGHHSHDQAGQYGYCYYNHVAVAARYAQTNHAVARVLIVDWDYHHGNGTEALFYEDPTVLYFSTHNRRAFPGTGSERRRGAGAGLGYTVNVHLGPGAGEHGGLVVAQGPADRLGPESVTAGYLNGTLSVSVPYSEEGRESVQRYLKLKGCRGNNLRDVDISFPLGALISITGVSGSGKSTLINETLYPLLARHFYRSKLLALPCAGIEGIEHIDKVVNVDQSPIGRTPRSNPATYTGAFTFIRDFFTRLPEAQIRGYKAGRFSFNVKGGRCEVCQGAGTRKIEMNFLPDVYVQCEHCKGERYNRETLQVKYKGKSIADVLEMPIEEAAGFFEDFPRIRRILDTMQSVGLGYLKLGQPSPLLSGGEAQRIKLSAELAKIQTGKTLYILDEPTTGLHFQDIQHLLEVLRKLVNKGNTVIVIEHNLDIVRNSDWIIDLGPEGGHGGGMIVAEGTPEAIARRADTHTGHFLKLDSGELLNGTD